MASSSGTDVTIIMNTANAIHNGYTVTGALPTGRYNSILNGYNQQVPSSGEVMVVPSGFQTMTDNGPYATRYRDPQATKVQLY